MKYIVAPFREQLQELWLYTASHWRKNTVAVITRVRVINDNLKRQIKNQTLYTCRLFLLTRIYQYISNWSKVFEHFLPPPSFFNIHRVIIFQIFLDKQFSSWSRRFLYKLGNTFYLSFLVHFQLWNNLWIGTPHQGNYFFLMQF